MPVDLDEIFAAGGTGLIDFLNYCVRSVQMDPIFAFLVDEYRIAPSAAKAVALYDTFLSPNAPARIDAAELLPPRDLALSALIQKLRPQPFNNPAPVAPIAAQPGKFIFDALSAHVRKNEKGAIAKIKKHYKASLSPDENLPDGKMTPGQRRFVDQVWQPRMRPMLIGAGFRRIANIA